VGDYHALVEEFTADQNVIGLILGGSRGRGLYIREDSDWDLYVVLRDGALLDEYAARYPSQHGDRIEVLLRSPRGLDNEPTWNRYTFCHLEPLLDRSEGWLAETLRRLTTVDPATAGEPLDAYVNQYYRAVKGTDETGRLLDAAESVWWFLEFVFAVHGRLRPYNKWLSWELEQHPLTWNDLPRLERIVATGGLADQQALFRDAEALARKRDLGAVIDGWEPDVARLRGGLD
jgi:predicted nucleotidyltransferase